MRRRHEGETRGLTSISSPLNTLPFSPKQIVSVGHSICMSFLQPIRTEIALHAKRTAKCLTVLVRVKEI